MNNWKKVTEIPPPTNTEVLVWIDELKLNGKSNLQIGRKILNGDTWIISNIFSFDFGEPTYWKELPRGPHEKIKNENNN